MDEYIDENDFLANDTDDAFDYTEDDGGGMNVDWPVVTDVLDSLFPYYTATVGLFGGSAPTPVTDAGAPAAEPTTNYTTIIIWGVVIIIAITGIAYLIKRSKK